MDSGELVELTAGLLDALAEATDHEPCEAANCLLCDGLGGRDMFSLLHGLEQAIGVYMVTPEAHASEAGREVHALLARMQNAPGLVPVPLAFPTAMLAPGLDPRGMHRLYTYLKAVSLGVAIGSGWPRIET